MLDQPAPLLEPDDRHWQIVARRDQAHAGRFVFGVTSTAIYCRPGCPARTPRRENVRLFPSPVEARAAGFRPCKRCRPDEPLSTDAATVARACRIIEAGIDWGDTVTDTDVANELNLTADALRQGFRRYLGVTPRQYAEARRLDRLRSALHRSGAVTPSVYDAGFAGPRRVYELADTALGMTPARFARGGAGETIRYVVVESPLGLMLAAATERGLCRLAFGDDAQELTRLLKEDFQAATLRVGDAAMAETVAVLLSLLAGDRPAAPLPLDIQATAFQARVWRALMAIPRGETVTYGELARIVGAPNAARAVGAACGQNPVAVIIPCHRVVGSTGKLTGYRWGTERKQRLLAQEGALD